VLYAIDQIKLIAIQQILIDSGSYRCPVIVVYQIREVNIAILKLFLAITGQFRYSRS
jgi:hypothetical protein